MPVDRTFAQDLAETLTALYRDTETRLAADVARRLAADLDAPDWAQRKLAGLASLRRHTEGVLARLATRSAELVEQLLLLAYVRGARSGLEEITRLGALTELERLALGSRIDALARLARLAGKRRVAARRELDAARAALPGLEALHALAFSLVSKLRGTHVRILRWTLDAYRDVIARTAAAPVLLGVATRRRAAQVAWEQLLSEGISGFVDKSGRRWELASYVEMATRSTVAQAAVQAHLDRLGDAGIDLVIVSDAPQECVRCRPWEGRVLTRVGGPGARTVERPHAVTGAPVRVDIAGSVVQAVAEGLMHPNCRHSLSAYLPGVTRVPTHTEDTAGDKARQELRRLERQVRKWKLRAAAAIDPVAKKGAQTKVREYQARIRAHVAATGLHRQPAREQIGVAR